MPGTAASGSRGNGSAGMNEAFENVVRKGIAGFYYVSTAQGLLETKARGIFRKRGLAPLPGDTVTLEEQEGSWVIAGVQPRKNTFVRPAVANVDVFFLVVSTCEPQPSTWVMDQLLAIAIDKGAQPVVVVTKTDLASGEELVRLYAQSGILSVAVNAATGDGLAELQHRIAGNICVFCGNSGVGKSTLLNALLPGLGQETAAISKKLGRGKHTTRQVELFEVCGGEPAVCISRNAAVSAAVPLYGVFAYLRKRLCRSAGGGGGKNRPKSLSELPADVPTGQRTQRMGELTGTLSVSLP